MIFYLAIHLGLTAVFSVACAVLSASERRHFSISFRTQLVISRGLLCLTLFVAIGATWIVRQAHLSWSVGLRPPESTPSPLSGLFPLPTLGSIFWVALGAMALFKTLRTSLEYRELSAVLRASVILRQHGRAIVVVSDRISVPLSLRTLRFCWVVVPSDLLASPENVRFAIRHEAQHHRQGDTSWAWIARVLSIVLWPNPVVHMWRRWQESVQELACDEALLERPGFEIVAYAQCLLSVAERALAGRQGLRLAPSMVARRRTADATVSHLQQRIEMLFAARSPRLPRPILAVTFGSNRLGDMR